MISLWITLSILGAIGTYQLISELVQQIYYYAYHRELLPNRYTLLLELEKLDIQNSSEKFRMLQENKALHQENASLHASLEALQAELKAEQEELRALINSAIQRL